MDDYLTNSVQWKPNYGRFEHPRTVLEGEEKTLFLACLRGYGFNCEPIDDYCLAYEISKSGKSVIIPLLTDFNPAHATQLFKDKALTYRLLDRLGIPFPCGTYFAFDKFTALDQLGSAIDTCCTLPFPLLVKPNDASMSRGVTVIGDANTEMIKFALKKAAEISRVVIAQEYLFGKELRVFAVDEKVLFALHKSPSPASPVELSIDMLESLCDYPSLAKCVKSIMTAARARVCCLDIIVNDRGFSILEVNSKPSLRSALPFIRVQTCNTYMWNVFETLWKE